MEFFSQSNDTKLQDSFIGCLVHTVYIDGEASDEEVNNLVLGFAGRNIFSGFDTTPVFKKHIFAQHTGDRDELLKECCEGLTDEWKPTVFAICCDLLFKDHLVSNDERFYLKKMKDYMRLPDETANKIIEVISMMYKGKI